MIRLNGIQISPTIFPDGTSQVWQHSHLANGVANRVEWNWTGDESELIHLHHLSVLLNKTCADAKNSLHIPYLPYARQDKAIGWETTFAFRTFADMLNLQRWDEVISFDVHNKQLAIDLIRNFRHLTCHPILTGYDYVVFPDQGAANRYSSYCNIPYVVASKVRDQSTGRITSYEIDNIESLYSSRVLVWDDICDGGATFIALAQYLVEAEVLDLYVSHGIFSKGLRDLLVYYNTIHTTNSLSTYRSMKGIDDTNLIVSPLHWAFLSKVTKPEKVRY